MDSDAKLPLPPVRSGDDGGLFGWLIAVLVIGGLSFFGPRMCSPQRTVAAAPAPVAAPAPPTEAKLSLPGGVTLTVPPGSIGEQLANFLANADPAPKTFTFDRLNFDSGASTLTADSTPTVDAIATILKAYTAAKVRLEGYTDSEGDDAANLRLSQQRVSTVTDLLVAKGVDHARMTGDGHGEANPIGDNATEEGRAKNRRLELTVTQK